MACLSSETIELYIENGLNEIEAALVRDHLLKCWKCHEEYSLLKKMNAILSKPVLITPPPQIERHVMKNLFPVMPSLASMMVFITTSFVFLVTLIYVYFDLANNSLIQAVELTSRYTSNYISVIIKGISTIFSFVYAFFKMVTKIISLVFNVSMGVNTFIVILALVVFIPLLPLLKKTYKKIKERI